MNITNDPAMLAAFAVMFGLFDYSTVPVTASIAASHLGLRMMGLAMGLLAAGHAVGGAAGALFAGRMYDLFARYDGVWLTSVGVAIFAGLICFTIRGDPAASTGSLRRRLKPKPPHPRSARALGPSPLTACRAARGLSPPPFGARGRPGP